MCKKYRKTYYIILHLIWLIIKNYAALIVLASALEIVRYDLKHWAPLIFQGLTPTFMN